MYVEKKAFSYPLDQVSSLKSEKMNMKIESPKKLRKVNFLFKNYIV